MRTCFKCKLSKPLDEFIRNRNKPLGHDYLCVDCKRDMMREFAKRPKYVEASRRYQTSPEGRAKINARRRRDYRLNKHKTYAKLMAEQAVRDGRIIKTPCIKCGNPDSRGHHPNYAKPLEVIWLCQAHHSEEHRRINAVV